MTDDDLMKQVNGAYLRLIHPTAQDDAGRQQIALVASLALSVRDELIATMVMGESWRERLLGLCLAMGKQPATFIEAMVQSLHEPRGIAIVPACAALAVLARRGIYAMPPSFSETFDRVVFDGEVGWAADKAMHFAGLRTADVAGVGPNYGQNFDDHVEVYSWVHAT